MVGSSRKADEQLFFVRRFGCKQPGKTANQFLVNEVSESLRPQVLQLDNCRSFLYQASRAIDCRFGHNQQDNMANQFLVSEDSESGFPKPQVEDVTPLPDVFQFPMFGRRRLLLDGISSSRRGPPQGQLTAA